MSEAIVEVRGNRKERVGVVVSDVQDKTIVVKVDRRTPHPLYQKTGGSCSMAEQSSASFSSSSATDSSFPLKAHRIAPAEKHPIKAKRS